MKMIKSNLILLLLLIFVNIITTYAQYSALEDTVTIIRDEFGIPHIIAENENALFFGAGCAAAEDRLFQMVLARRAVQGRLAEIFGDSFLDSDIKMLTLGLYRHAQRTLPQLSKDAQAWLKAYADGVNAYIKDNRHLSELFAQYGGEPEEWKPEDCIACQMRIAERFDGAWKNEISRLREYETLSAESGSDSAIKILEMRGKNVDDYSAIVSKEEYDSYQEKFENLKTVVVKGKKIKNDKIQNEWESPKMSHNWCVAGSRTASGYPILESDPQIAVEAPATWYEFHLQGGRFNVRGISVPGTPSMLLGFNEYCAWGLTALGGDCADLYQEELNADSTQYKWLAGWENLAVRNETIKIKGTRDYNLNVLETRHGPIVNNLLKGVRTDEYFALQYLVTHGPASSIEALLDMMAATNWNEFTAGMSKYKSPATNLIYADKYDNIAYYTLAGVPNRVHNGGFPYIGWSGEEEWKGVVPFDSMPRMLNPDAGFISTANNLPIGSWYPYHVGGAIGDNSRSLRLKELLIDGQNLIIEDFFRMHRNAVDPIARDFVIYGIMAVDEENPDNQDAKKLADLIRDWDYKMLSSYHSYSVVSKISTTIKRSIRQTPLEERYLGSDAGLIQIFRDLNAFYDTTGMLMPDTDIRDWLINQMGEVYVKSDAANAGGRPVTLTHKMLYQNNLEGYGSLARDYDINSPPLHCDVVATIWSQKGNSYSQIVNYADVDSSFSILPPGNSEVPDNKHFDDMIDLWVEGGMHIAPLSLEEVEKIEEMEKVLYPGTVSVNDDEQQDINITIYPNPFCDRTKITVRTVIRSNYRIEIFNAFGQLIRSHDEKNIDGYYYLWDGKDKNGKTVGNGIYYVQINIDGKIFNSKIMFIK
ncbi:penicillin acylase family protein [Bacteroidota bacterium]